MTQAAYTTKAPVWFIAHGGPPTLFEIESAPHQHWLQIGKDLRQANLRGIVFVSAHWQAEDDDFAEAASSKSILINNNVSNPLIYDFYGFPQSYYTTRFISSNPTELQQAVAKHLKKEGYIVAEKDRGPDHGVWVPLRASGEHFDIPLIQVSLPVSKTPLEDGTAALRLGRALRGLRRSGYAIIGGGQPVHNLRDYMTARQGTSLKGGDYGQSFAAALTQALAKAGNSELGGDGDPKRWADAKALFGRDDYLRAHPTSEHLLPALVALGAAEESEAGVETFREDGASSPLMWNMYKFG